MPRPSSSDAERRSRPEERRPLALTQGDPSGIGPDIAIGAWSARDPDDTPFYLLADPAVVRQRAQRLGVDIAIAECDPADAAAIFAHRLPVFPLAHQCRGVPGAPDADDAPATMEAIERAVTHVREGVAGAVVTNPIAKDVLYRAGFAHPGHTEFLGELAARLWGVQSPRPVMMLWCEELAVVPVTIHIPLTEVAQALTPRLLEETLVIVDRDLRERFGIARPRIACTGLNPHAGEAGTMGREEVEFIGPVIERLKARGLDLSGPYPADTLFTGFMRPTYDAAVAMYHDQALIPIKTLAFDEGVNATLGLPFVRTSPDHGTAFALAGSGKARPSSLQAALGLAGRLSGTER